MEPFTLSSVVSAFSQRPTWETTHAVACDSSLFTSAAVSCSCMALPAPALLGRTRCARPVPAWRCPSHTLLMGGSGVGLLGQSCVLAARNTCASLVVAHRLVVRQAAAARPLLRRVSEAGAACGTPSQRVQTSHLRVDGGGMPVFLTEGWALGPGRHSAHTWCMHV